MIRDRLEELERAGVDPHSPGPLVVLAWLASGRVEIPADALNGARRRAMLVLAAGGDPHRDLTLDSIAAERLADELDAPERREQLESALAELAAAAAGLPGVLAALAGLRADRELAWRCFALALLADELAGE